MSEADVVGIFIWEIENLTKNGDMTDVLNTWEVAYWVKMTLHRVWNHLYHQNYPFFRTTLKLNQMTILT